MYGVYTYIYTPYVRKGQYFVSRKYQLKQTFAFFAMASFTLQLRHPLGNSHCCTLDMKVGGRQSSWAPR